MDTEQRKFEEILKKVEEAKKSGGLDLSIEEDLSIAIMNLISLEEHFFFTGVKTGKTGYFDLLNEVRAMRKELLGKMIDRKEGETWCVAKHLLAASMRLIEVGTKLQSENKKTEAKDLFAKAHSLYSIFWALRLKLLSPAEIKNNKMAALKPWSFDEIMDKLVDCCDE